MSNQPYISVCIPCYDMGGVGHVFLRESFEKLTKQTFRDFEVVISDYSKTPLVKQLCEEYRTKLPIQYFVNADTTGGMAANANNAIRHAKGKIIKIVFQDDFLYDHNALQVIADTFDLNADTWLATGCEHTTDGKTFYRPHYPTYNRDVYKGNNTIGSPSVIAFKNDHPLLFDPKLKWLVDCDLYKRYNDTFGPPKLTNAITVAIRTGDHQITNTEATVKLRREELRYVIAKYRKKLHLPTVSLVSVTGLNPAGAIQALKLSMEHIHFHESILIAHDKPVDLPFGITFKACLPTDLQSKEKKNTNDYSKFMAYRLPDYITSDHVLIVHNDAYVLRPEKWDNEFLRYDYIGAPWPKDVHFTNERVNVRVGNGGFSLRSKRMLNILNELHLPFTDNGTGFFHEDGILCVYYRKLLEDAGMRFAPVDVAAKFSLEKVCEESTYSPFGFHNNKKAIPKLFALRRFFRTIFPKL